MSNSEPTTVSSQIASRKIADIIVEDPDEYAGSVLLTPKVGNQQVFKLDEMLHESIKEV